jgi:Cu+-exporting ATPase
MGVYIPAMERWLASLMSEQTRVFLELGLATPVCVWAAWPFFVRAVQSVKNRSLNMFTVIGLGVFVAYTHSLVAALLPGIFPASFRDPSGQVDVYFAAAAMSFSSVSVVSNALRLRRAAV